MSDKPAARVLGPEDYEAARTLLLSEHAKYVAWMNECLEYEKRGQRASKEMVGSPQGHRLDLGGEDLSFGRFDHMKSVGGSFRGAYFEICGFQKSTSVDSEYSGSKFPGSNLGTAEFEGATLPAEIRGAILAPAPKFGT
jgi:hypothetical protein